MRCAPGIHATHARPRGMCPPHTPRTLLRHVDLSGKDGRGGGGSGLRPPRHGVQPGLGGPGPRDLMPRVDTPFSHCNFGSSFWNQHGTVRGRKFQTESWFRNLEPTLVGSEILVEILVPECGTKVGSRSWNRQCRFQKLEPDCHVENVEKMLVFPRVSRRLWP